MEVQLKLWKSNKCATLPTCNSLLQVPFCFGCLKMQEQRFPKYWFSFTCLMPWFRSSLLLFLDALCSFIIARMRVGLNTQLRTCGCIAQIWWHLSLEDLPIQRKHAKAFFSSNVPFSFFCWGPSGRRPKVRKNASKVRKYPSSLDPSEPKGLFFQKTPFSSRPSIRQNCFSSWHHKIRASGCPQTPWMFRISVAMCKCLPPQLIKLQKAGEGFIVRVRRELWIQSCSAMKF